MTANQIAYNRHLEDIRHNVAQEAENYRTNVAQEQERSRANTLNYNASIYASDVAKYNAEVSAAAHRYSAELSAAASKYQTDTNAYWREQELHSSQVTRDLNYDVAVSNWRESIRHNKAMEENEYRKTSTTIFGNVLNAGMKLLTGAALLA